MPGDAQFGGVPSTVVHLAVAALLAAALLGPHFDHRSLAVVLAATAVPDLDTFLGMVVQGTHRAALHTLLVPLTVAVLVVWDTRYRERSFLRQYGDRGVLVAWVAVAAYLLAGIGPDLFFNGVNVLYPVVDRFVELNGEVYLSNTQGLVQTVWTFEGDATPMMGTTETTHYQTGVDPTRGADPADAERLFPVAMSGLQLLLILTALVVTPVRLWLAERA